MESRTAVLSPWSSILETKKPLASPNENQRKPDTPPKRAEPLPLTALADIFKILKNEGTL